MWLAFLYQPRKHNCSLLENLCQSVVENSMV